MANLDLDDLNQMQAVDTDNMLGHIDALADQFEAAWQHAQAQPLPTSHADPRRIVLCGMGGSAIGGSLTAALVAATAPVPFTVVRGYDLPAYACSPDTLVIASSFSGNTEETLAAADDALGGGAKLLAITTGGQLADHARANGYPLWQFDYTGQPRAALGWSFGLLLGLAARLDLAPALGENLKEGIDLLRQHQATYAATSPVGQNPAKRTAGQLIGRMPVIFGAGVFEPVARRWKGQFNENAKAWAQYDPLPEGNHNTVVGIEFPSAHGLELAALFILSRRIDHPRTYLRHDLTHQLALQNGIMADRFEPAGDSALAQMLHAIQYGDYVSYYLAMAYGVDPTPVAPISELKEQLARHS